MTQVLDASLLVSALSPKEVSHTLALETYRACPAGVPLLVPAIFPLEVLAALARRGAKPAALLAVEALLRTRRFAEVAVDRRLLRSAIAVATSARLRAADAIYAALALDRGATLITLDQELAARLRTAYPTLRVDPS